MTRHSLPALEKLDRLPIDAHLSEIVEAVQSHSVVVVQATPGAGKTTRVPVALLAAHSKKILVLEPRRLAAKVSAQRVAHELRQVGFPPSVGYQFRFERSGNDQTRLWFYTEGMFLKKLLSDPELLEADVVVLDEFHERHLQADLALAYVVRLIQTTRPTLKCVVMSATLDTEFLSQYFLRHQLSSKTITVHGQVHSVTIEHLPHERAAQPLVQKVASALESTQGDTLVFLPGMREIRECESFLSQRFSRDRWRFLVLHGDLDLAEQEKIFETGDFRRVILATNIAETSLTISGITTVLDSGLARQASVSASGLGRLLTQAVSKASSIQRTGRAGRTQSGKCIRLYSKFEYESRAPYEVPEIQRADLIPVLLELKKLGIRQAADGLPWLDVPATRRWDDAERVLVRLGLLDGAFELTALGRKCVALPLHPRLAVVFYTAIQAGCSAARAARFCAWISESSTVEGDLSEAFLKAEQTPSFAERRIAERILDESGVGQSRGSCGETLELKILEKSVFIGFFDRVARLKKTNEAHGFFYEWNFATSGSGSARVPQYLAPALQHLPVSALAVVLDVTEKKQAAGALYTEAKNWTLIDESWLWDVAEEKLEVLWDSDRKRVDVISRVKFEQLVLDESKPVRSEFVIRTGSERLVAEVFARGIGLVADAERLKNIQLRFAFLARERSEWAERLHPWVSGRGSGHQDQIKSPDFDNALREQLLEFSISIDAKTFDELKKADFEAYFTSSLPYEWQQEMLAWVPQVIRLPGGGGRPGDPHVAKGAAPIDVIVHYLLDQPPYIESRLQDFVGLEQTPCILKGSYPLVLHLLAPSKRPVQVTRDLASFWKNTYPEVRKELCRQYPRHAWP